MAIACSTSVRCASPLEEALAFIAGLGFRNVDLLAIDGWAHVNTRDLDEHWETTVGRVEALLKRHKLTPVAVNSGVSPQLHQREPGINAQRKKEVRALLRFLRRFGIPVAAIQPRQPDPGRPWAEVLRDCAATLREQFAAGDEAGVEFALELHIRSPFETLAQARRLIEALPEVRLVYDPSHFVMQGVALRETEWLMDRASHVHLRDAAPGQMQTPFGQGAVDFDWLFGALKERGYAGHFSIEYLESKEQEISSDVCRLRDAIAKHFDA